jgi:hypothetical protein
MQSGWGLRAGQAWCDNRRHDQGATYHVWTGTLRHVPSWACRTHHRKMRLTKQGTGNDRAQDRKSTHTTAATDQCVGKWCARNHTPVIAKDA